MAKYEAQCSKVGNFDYSQNFKLYVELWQDSSQNDIDIANNKSRVRYNVYCKAIGSGSIDSRHFKYFKLNGQDIINLTEQVTVSSPDAYIHIASGTTDWIGHNSDGNQAITFSAQIKANSYGVSASISDTFALSAIPRYAEINSFSIKSMGLNTATLQYSVSRVAHIYCSVDGRLWELMVANTTSGTFTISGLSPNTNHSFAILVRAVDSGLDRISNTLFGNTLDIARISNLPNIEHANDFIVGITNPANISSLNLVMSIDNSQILNRSVSTGNNTIKMTDDELDNLYKKYGSSNSLTASFVLSGSGYSEQKTCIVTLTGNQKTIYISAKRGKVFVGTKRGVTWQNVNGIWKRGG